MGKNYPEEQYKKTYKDEYLKTYDKGLSRSATMPYTGLNPTPTGSVNSEGPNRRRSKQNSSASEKTSSEISNTNREKKEQKALQTEKIGRVISQPTSSPPPPVPPQYNPSKQNTSVSEERKTHVGVKVQQLNPNLYDHPIRTVGKDKYEEIQSGKVVGVSEARRILENDGYVVKKSKVLTILSIISFMSFAFHPLMPIILTAMAWLSKNKNYTDYEKNDGMHKLRFQLPASNSEIELNNKRSTIFMVLGIVLTIISVVILINK